MTEDDDTKPVPTEDSDTQGTSAADAPAPPEQNNNAAAATSAARPIRDRIARWGVAQRAIAVAGVLVLVGVVVFAATSFHHEQTPRFALGSRAFAACMRQHGVEFPAPRTGATGPGFGAPQPGGHFAPPPGAGGRAAGTGAPAGGALQPAGPGLSPPGAASSSGVRDAFRACQGYLHR
jgi:hypothetical protein